MAVGIADLANVYGVEGAQTTKVADKSTNKKAGTDLDMNDYLELMVAMLKNQTMDSTADTSEMMSQMVQMSVVQAITSISELISESTSMSYAASMVGKEVTIGQYDENGDLQEIVGTITGTGTLKGQQVVFIGDDSYYLSDIMAVGRLPANKEALGGEETDQGSKPPAAS